MEKIQLEKPEIIALIKTFQKKDGQDFVEKLKQDYSEDSSKHFVKKRIVTLASESLRSDRDSSIALVKLPFMENTFSVQERFEVLCSVGIFPIDVRGTYALASEYNIFPLLVDEPLPGITVLGSHVEYKDRERVAKSENLFVSQIRQGPEDELVVNQKTIELFSQEKKNSFILALVRNTLLEKTQKPIAL